ncbi:DUF488 domain-containing protein [Crossiella cryophila]|uniref:Uncharacterized protein (DUF488 family) n=1 Tax=Crossiella cryophila TaxID=43355 RepID=A0A7W7FVV0_9PSEU|nr:DUF488 domain-containing protein [Crossiella cryophila]MBB4679657.1 uncharacterized protein (DUF488 family) [Crossiella cryophila]
MTIGVYGDTAETFLRQLTGKGVGLLLDLRQRRGVRGPDYAWANSARLQQALATANIGYRHLKDLAPTTELRQLQYREDDRQGVGKRNRVTLAPAYIDGYTRQILDPFDLGGLAAELPTGSVTALFCVERDPAACHRSLVAARLLGYLASTCPTAAEPVSNSAHADCQAASPGYSSLRR